VLLPEAAEDEPFEGLALRTVLVADERSAEERAVVGRATGAV